jgi:hypothetical protein
VGADGLRQRLTDLLERKQVLGTRSIEASATVRRMLAMVGERTVADEISYSLGAVHSNADRIRQARAREGNPGDRTQKPRGELIRRFKSAAFIQTLFRPAPESSYREVTNTVTNRNGRRCAPESVNIEPVRPVALPPWKWTTVGISLGAK